MTDTPLHYMTITELAALIEGRELSPVEVTNVTLDRIDEKDERLKSYATVMADHAVASAQRAEREIAGGDYRGPLHGVPDSSQGPVLHERSENNGRRKGVHGPRAGFRLHGGGQTGNQPGPCCWAS